jgi:F-type H+-transporting ATPase subunit delta
MALAVLSRRAGSLLGANYRAAPIVARMLHATGARLADASDASTLSLNFTLPSKSIYVSAPVSLVNLPGSDGEFGVMAKHVPTISTLKPGVVSVQEEADGPMKKYFISGGFASVNEESVLSISTLEACELEDIDPDAVKVGLAQYSEAYASATDDLLKAEAEIGVEVYQSLSYAIA